MGTVNPEDGPARAVFHVVNTGAQTVAIAHIYTSCSCTTTDLATPTLAPGENTTLNVGLRVGLSKKRFTQAIRLATTEPGAPLVTARIIGELDAGVFLDNERVDFGDHSLPDLPLVQRLYAHEVSDRIERVSTTVKGLALEVLRGSGNIATIVCRLCTGPPGPIEGVITILTAEQRTHTIPVRGRIDAAVRSRPYCLTFFLNTAGAETWQPTVTVINDFHAPVKQIRSPEFLPVILRETAPGGAELSVKWDPVLYQDHAAPERAEIAVLFKDEQELRIPVYFWR